MKRFIINSLLLLTPILGVLILIWSFQPKESQKWYRLKNNCFKSICNYEFINNKSNPIDIAFIGTSRTMNSVNDITLTKEWNQRVVNLGYCRPGRNVQYELLKLLFENHRPKAVFIEINQEEDWYGHHDFGNVASTKDVLYSITDRNPKYLRDVRFNFVMKVDLFQRKLLNKNYFGAPCASGYVKNGHHAQGLVNIAYADTNTISQRFTSELYLKRMIDLCILNNAKVYFHYLPTFGLVDYSPHHKQLYLSYGEVFYPPNELLDTSYWGDASHLNTQGARLFTEKLAAYYSFD